MNSQTFDPVWELIYGEGRQLNKYPWDSVVSFVFNNYPREKLRAAVRIIEIGCGAGSNLWFAAREGFQVAGVDGSASAIEFARRRFLAEGLIADLRVADFTALPFPDGTYDLAIDRGALTCCGFAAARRAISEVRRVLAPRGRFFFNPYSEAHSSRLAGRTGPDGVVCDIEGGSLTGVGQICFYTRNDVEAALSSGWRVLQWRHVENREESVAVSSIHAEWQVVVERSDDHSS